MEARGMRDGLSYRMPWKEDAGHSWDSELLGYGDRVHSFE